MGKIPPSRRRRAAPPPRNPGLPDPGTVTGEAVLVSPRGRRYRILRTTERDPGDPADPGARPGRTPPRR